MNQKKFGKIFKALLSTGVSVDDATKSAAKLANKIEKTEPKIERSKPGRKSSGNSLREQLLQYAQSRKGNVWSLQAAARALNASPNSLSTQLTSLTQSGKIVRVGRGEYRKAH